MRPALRLAEVARLGERVVLGMMSGTSMDGLDLALIRITAGERPVVRTLQHRTVSHPAELETALRRCLDWDLPTLARMNTALGRFYAAAAAGFCAELDVLPDLVGLHGQTVYHEHLVTTLQIGDPAPLALALGCPVVSDFRSGDVAAGGSGAPLVPVVDRLLLADPARTTVALNLGGIANVTILPAEGSSTAPLGFDTGPANGLIDAAIGQLSQGARSYDRDGAMAARGRIDRRLLDRLLAHPFFALPPPRSTGKEVFGAALVTELIQGHERAQGDPADLVATLTELTAQSVARAIRRHAPDAAVVVASGGGVRNPVLMAWLGTALGGIGLVTSDAFGIDPDAKEAIAFAVLASLRVDGLPGNLPEATGAARPVLLGRIAEA